MNFITELYVVNINANIYIATLKNGKQPSRISCFPLCRPQAKIARHSPKSLPSDPCIMVKFLSQHFLLVAFRIYFLSTSLYRLEKIHILYMCADFFLLSESKINPVHLDLVL